MIERFASGFHPFVLPFMFGMVFVSDTVSTACSIFISSWTTRRGGSFCCR